jgi:asparagine synthase (glutamine-hydrolysing)
MCGILLQINKASKSIDNKTFISMLSSINHRGPDSQGAYYYKNIGIGHARLSVIDISKQSNQPIKNDNYMLSFNGEIFNYQELKRELLPSHIDSEMGDTLVLFELLVLYGSLIINKLEGQFSFVFINKKTKEILVARDGVGICPLYKYEDKELIIFSSELRPFWLIRKAELNKSGLFDYLKFRYLPGSEYSMFKNVQKIMPGTFSILDFNGNINLVHKFWGLELSGNKRKKIDFNNLISKSVESNLVSDIPVGVYLSAGVDSQAVYNCAKRVNPNLMTFTLDIGGSAEADLVKKNHSNLQAAKFFNIDIKSLENDLIKSIKIMEEPFGDFLIVSNYLLAKDASKYCKVFLSGEGGDEAFLGYHHIKALIKLEKFACMLPLGFLGKALNFIPSALVGYISGYPGSYSSCEKKKISKILSKFSSSKFEAYLEAITLFSDEEIFDLFGLKMKSNATKSIKKIFKEESSFLFATYRSEIEQLTLVVNLMKQDKFSSWFSTESRVPLVSKDILDSAKEILSFESINPGKKRILRNISKVINKDKVPISYTYNKAVLEEMRSLYMKYVINLLSLKLKMVNERAAIKMYENFNPSSILNIKKFMSLIVIGIWIELNFVSTMESR